MSRIYTDEPSTGKNIIIAAKNVPTDWTTISEAPDFSVPLGGSDTVTLDPLDPERELRAGEVFIGAPILVTNRSFDLSLWIEFRIILETAMEFPLASDPFVISVSPRVPISFAESIQIPLQGLVLLKSDVSLDYGGRLQVRASAPNLIDLYGSASESAYADHAPNTEGV